MLLGPRLASLMLCLMTTYSKILLEYPKDIVFVSLTKYLKSPFDSQKCCIILP
jgi:hypothetical protein